MRPGAVPRRTLVKALGSVPVAAKQSANPPRHAPGGVAEAAARQCAKPPPAARPQNSAARQQKPCKKRAKAGRRRLQPPRPASVLRTQKGRCMFLTHTAPRMFAIHSCNADRLQNTARHILPGSLSLRGLCPRPAPVPCFTGREKCCIMSLQGAALSRGV